MLVVVPFFKGNDTRLIASIQRNDKDTIGSPGQVKGVNLEWDRRLVVVVVVAVILVVILNSAEACNLGQFQ